MDAIDLANANAERVLQSQIAHQTKFAHSNRPSAKYCAECGEPISEARRKAVAGRQRCVACQTIREGRHGR